MSRALSPPPTGRAVYFVVVLWGKRFRDYFLDYCLPSLMAPGNIPSLEPDAGHRLLACTTREDWDAMCATPIFAELRRYVEPILLEIPPAPPGVGNCTHMGVGHKIATDMAYQDRALVVHLTPDMMLSDGALTRSMEHCRNGTHVVLAVALRLCEEDYFGQLEQRGLLDRKAPSRAQTCRPLAIPARQMAAAAVRSFHSESHTYHFEASWFCRFPVVSWWRMADGDGIVVHSLSWAPILLDYAAMTDHDTSAIETWTIDGNYIDANFSGRARFHVVADSDELMVTSWAPASDRPRPLKDNWGRGDNPVGRWVRANILRRAYYSPIFDDMKRSCFAIPVRWHGSDLDEAWTEREARCTREAFRAVGLPPYEPGPFRRLSAIVFDAVVRLERVRYYGYLCWRTLELSMKMMTGDADARRRLAGRARQVLVRAGLGGKSGHG